METTQSRNLADRLRAAREMAGLSQGQVARLLEVHRPCISEIEAGRRKVSADELARFSDLYGVELDWLLGKVAQERDPAVELAARELSKLRPEDLERVVHLLKSIKRPAHSKQ